MKKATPTDIINESILLLEIKREEELRALKKQFHITYESLRPINIIKNTFREITESPDLKGGIGNAAIGIGFGFLAKNILFRSSRNPIKRLISIAAQALITNVAAKHSDRIKESGKAIFQAVMEKITPKKREFHEGEIYQ